MSFKSMDLQGVAPRLSVVVITVIAAVAVLSLVGTPQLTGLASAVQNSSSTNVTLSIAEETIVSVQPDAYNFSDMGLGSTNFSDTTTALELRIINDGSTNISKIYAHPDTLDSEQDNPLGTGRAGEYAAGRFLWIQNDTSRFYHAGTLTWNITDAAGGEPTGITNEPNNAISTGFYRNATGDYLWQLSANGTGSNAQVGSWNFCNSTTKNAPVVTIKTEVDNDNNRDMSQNTEDYVLDGGRDGNWSMAFIDSATETGPLVDHYVAAYKDCTKVYAYRFDADPYFPMNDPSPPRAAYLNNETLSPGDQFTGRVGAAVPQGIPAGTTNLTTLTITATSVS